VLPRQRKSRGGKCLQMTGIADTSRRLSQQSLLDTGSDQLRPDFKTKGRDPGESRGSRVSSVSIRDAPRDEVASPNDPYRPNDSSDRDVLRDVLRDDVDDSTDTCVRP
jgi:hypothetical protein